MAAVSKRIASVIRTPRRRGQLGNLDTTADGADRSWVAVLGQWRKGCLRLPLPYVEAVAGAGHASKVLSPFELLPSERVPEDLELHTELDPFDAGPLEGAAGLVLCGGGDVDPDLYGRTRHVHTHNVSQKRDRFELTYLAEALEQDMPVLCICRGMQLLNVHLGGTLDQHLMDNPDRLDHYRDRPIAEPAHGLTFKEKNVMADAMGGLKHQVNTHHHQGLEDVAEPLKEVGWAEDGVLEAVVSSEHTWVWGVQWHPEAMVPMHEPQTRLFDAFGAAVSSYVAKAEAPGFKAQSA